MSAEVSRRYSGWGGGEGSGEGGGSVDATDV